ncbi:adhesion G protein-coupled receptor L4-like [Glandiceps talaboti]
MEIICNTGMTTNGTGTTTCGHGTFDPPVPECINTNECSTEPGICGIHATCRDTVGSYICECLPNYAKDKSDRCVPRLENEGGSEIVDRRGKRLMHR